VDNKVGHHISQQFDKELEDIRNKVLIMGGLVEQQIELAIKAFSTSDMELAEKVIKQDDQVNSMETSIDQECIQIIALRQPTAFDLRLLISVIKILTEIERAGDQAKRIAQMAIHLAADTDHTDSFYELKHISAMIREMLHDALDAFARMTTDEVMSINARDENVNREYKSIMRQLITRMMEDPRTISRSLDVLWTARALERIGDHSCNIGEYVVYMIKGEDIRHIRNLPASKC
jgi:phosphate transport system protein